MSRIVLSSSKSLLPKVFYQGTRKEARRPEILEPAVCPRRSPGTTASCCCYDFHPGLPSGLNAPDDPPFRNKLSPASHKSTSINNPFSCSTSHLQLFLAQRGLLRLLKCNRNLLGFASVPKGLIKTRRPSPLCPSSTRRFIMSPSVTSQFDDSL